MSASPTQPNQSAMDAATDMDAATETVMPAVYATHLLYRVGAGLCLLLVALFVWEASRSLLAGTVEVGTFLFLALAVALLLRNGWLALSRVEVGPQQVTLHRPLLPPRSVIYRQLAEVYEEGRWRKAILLTYHPRRGDGLYELDQLLTLALPAVKDHDGLYAILTARTPRITH